MLHSGSPPNTTGTHPLPHSTPPHEASSSERTPVCGLSSEITLGYLVHGEAASNNNAPASSSRRFPRLICNLKQLRPFGTHCPASTATTGLLLLAAAHRAQAPA